MKTPTWARIILWLIAVAAITTIGALRIGAIIGGNANNGDIVILVLWVAMIIAPAFGEVDLFGVKIKRELETLRDHVDSQFATLRSDINNNVNLRSEINPQINITIPPDKELRQLAHDIKQEVVNVGIEPMTTILEDIPDKKQYLMSTQFKIENELRMIAGPNFNLTKREILEKLLMNEAIGIKIYRSIRDIDAICSAARSGKPITEAQIRFVQEVTPEIIKYLRNIPQEVRNYLQSGPLGFSGE